jgi:queuine tRNA-ribosyltransferase
MTALNHEVVRTRGGALAMRSLDAGEVMHPGVGPLIEAQQLYVRQSRLSERLLAGTAAGNALTLFDVGLGAGSNALAARAASEQAPAHAARLHLLSFERDLGALELALSHSDAFALDGEPALAARAVLQHGHHETPRTSWRLERGDLLDGLTRAQATPADVIFWDPFSPKANPRLWTVGAFAAARRAAGPRCTLFTYSASTTTRVALLLAGWAVGIGDGIGDKAATTAAAVLACDLAQPLDQRWLTRLSRSQAPLPADAPADAITRVGAAPQF